MPSVGAVPPEVVAEALQDVAAESPEESIADAPEGVSLEDTQERVSEAPREIVEQAPQAPPQAMPQYEEMREAGQDPHISSEDRNEIATVATGLGNGAQDANADEPTPYNLED